MSSPDAQENIADLVIKFDQDKDGKISLDEFMNFTLAIPHMAFKAERSRRRSTMNSHDATGHASGSGVSRNNSPLMTCL